MNVVKDPQVQPAPGSVVVVRDEEWFVRATEATDDGLLVHVQGLGELVRDTTASFYASLDHIAPLDPALATVVPDGTPRYRTARLADAVGLGKTLEIGMILSELSAAPTA